MSHILITAGPTRAYIDDVRYLTNASSGRMACALAEAALAKGHSVSIVSGPVSVQYPAEARVSSVITTGDMLKKSLTLLPRFDGVIATGSIEPLALQWRRNEAQFLALTMNLYQLRCKS